MKIVLGNLFVKRKSMKTIKEYEISYEELKSKLNIEGEITMITTNTSNKTIIISTVKNE